ncbi:hypothetical protein PTSG_11566 [Salpingoeca rosetta]|uniref:Uncharacterized protein n=1 Tax=Salpingoeca rosetta (strain ATCC 50818 / BSB-021) TaxID=946362 RepID=F2TVY2_SALR5|nr:uncharacterized protein PTSG_11566 [Salpingoeca rosetta]EGD72228.1 hypothetical protein PTSG_11566 [Salpingoeca rosetta]|eukprot:XP_004998799.1 hypothetical protein PTSG_11566 [Salpingoeca rosetta]
MYWREYACVCVRAHACMCATSPSSRLPLTCLFVRGAGFGPGFSVHIPPPLFSPLRQAWSFQNHTLRGDHAIMTFPSLFSFPGSARFLALALPLPTPFYPLLLLRLQPPPPGVVGVSSYSQPLRSVSCDLSPPFLGIVPPANTCTASPSTSQYDRRHRRHCPLSSPSCMHT